jgi:SPP1 gp7 family putative phage head morphogenesis protein
VTSQAPLALVTAAGTGGRLLDILAQPFEAALRWFRRRLPMRKAAWEKLPETAKKRAFTVAHVAQLSVVTDVWHAVDAAIEKGEDFRSFKQKIADKLKAAWGVKPAPIPAAPVVPMPGAPTTDKAAAARIETVFRNAVQNAYAAGRYEQQTEPVVLKLRPYLQYVSILDGRTTPHCLQWNGVILPVDDPLWAGHTPPCHHRCRATTRSLRKSQLEALGGVTAKVPETAAAKGFGGLPTGKPFEPDPAKYPPALFAEYEKKASGGSSGGAPPVPPPPPPPPSSGGPPPPSSRSPARVQAAFEALPEMPGNFNFKRRSLPEGITAKQYKQLQLTALEGDDAAHDAVRKYTYKYGWVLHELDRGGDPAELARKVDAYRASQPKTKRWPNANGTEHVAMAQAAFPSLKRALATLPEVKIEVLRGMKDISPRVAAGFLQAESFTLEGITSASRKAGIAANYANLKHDRSADNYGVVLKVRLKSGVPIEAHSGLAGECEVVMKRGTKLRVLSRTKFVHHEGATPIIVIECEEQ